MCKKLFKETLHFVTYLQQHYIQYIACVVGNIPISDYYLIKTVHYYQFFP
jgi:hypothetical protein